MATLKAGYNSQQTPAATAPVQQAPGNGEQKFMTLLEKAKQVPPDSESDSPHDIVELAIEWATGNLVFRQVKAAFGDSTPSGAPTYTSLALGLKTACARGILVVAEPQPE